MSTIHNNPAQVKNLEMFISLCWLNTTIYSIESWKASSLRAQAKNPNDNDDILLSIYDFHDSMNSVKRRDIFCQYATIVSTLIPQLLVVDWIKIEKCIMSKVTRDTVYFLNATCIHPVER